MYSGCIVLPFGMGYVYLVPQTTSLVSVLATVYHHNRERSWSKMHIPEIMIIMGTSYECVYLCLSCSDCFYLQPHVCADSQVSC